MHIPEQNRCSYDASDASESVNQYDERIFYQYDSGPSKLRSDIYFNPLRPQGELH